VVSFFQNDAMANNFGDRFGWSVLSHFTIHSSPSISLDLPFPQRSVLDLHSSDSMEESQVCCHISILLFDSHSYLLAVGVDLGTTFSVVGVRMGGKVKIIEDEQRRVIFPSVVSYLDNGGLISLTFYSISTR
jgi:hypothetical protein